MEKHQQPIASGTPGVGETFNKVDGEEIFEAMNRMEISTKLPNLAKSIYKDTEFKAETDGHSSDRRMQHTGIR